MKKAATKKRKHLMDMTLNDVWVSVKRKIHTFGKALSEITKEE